MVQKRWVVERRGKKQLPEEMTGGWLFLRNDDTIKNCKQKKKNKEEDKKKKKQKEKLVLSVVHLSTPSAIGQIGVSELSGCACENPDLLHACRLFRP